jgi:tRNA uridine 5-carboxymethylaminomethyl modification enzyme
MGLRVLVFCLNLDTVAQMSCNPAIGGLAKGHLVKEIDALGGAMGRITDRCGIQFRTLNTSRGPAVQGTRVQCDKLLYHRAMKQTMEEQPGIEMRQVMIERLLVENSKVCGVVDETGFQHRAAAIIITTGTFLNGLIHIGSFRQHAGRSGEFAARALALNLRNLGLKTGRMKTGTPPRMLRSSIDFSALERQDGIPDPLPFSVMSAAVKQEQLPCYLTRTTAATHALLRDNLDLSPLYNGTITGVSARYCPSLEDKIVKFPHHESHQVTLEPEGYETEEIYVKGLGNCLPVEVQQELFHTVPGLEDAVVTRPACAIEYDFVEPTQLKVTLECKKLARLYLAGQINGTSGYEEAAAQGIIAGINAACQVKGLDPFVLDRSEAYAAVMIDDLISRGTREPYRMFTSRAEYRLLLREDNADLRLTERAFSLGLVESAQVEMAREKQALTEAGKQRLKSIRIKPAAAAATLERLETPALQQGILAAELLKRPQVRWPDLEECSDEVVALGDYLGVAARRQTEIQIKYDGYIKRQLQAVEKFKHLEKIRIPENFSYRDLPGLTIEMTHTLDEIRPRSLGQASRLPGVTPAAISTLMIYLKKHRSNS